MIYFLVGDYTGYSCMCMQSVNLICLSMRSGGVLTQNIIKDVEIYSNQPKRNIGTNSRIKVRVISSFAGM